MSTVEQLRAAVERNPGDWILAHDTLHGRVFYAASGHCRWDGAWSANTFRQAPDCRTIAEARDTLRRLGYEVES